MLRAVSRVVSGKEALSSASSAGSSIAWGGGSDVRTVRVPSPPHPAAVSSPTFAGGAAVWTDWETVEGEAEEELGLEELRPFGAVPSSDEVQAAVWSVQQFVPLISFLLESNFFTQFTERTT